MAKLKKRDKKRRSVKDRYQKRDQEVLEKTYEEKDKQSEGGNRGKTIFDPKKLVKYGIEEYPKPKMGKNYLIFLPLSIEDKSKEYFRELCCHYGVGMDNDQYICMSRENFSNEKCKRCIKQSEGWKVYDKNNPKMKKQLTSMYPTDRAAYLLYDVTSYFTDEEEPKPIIQVWSAPKKAVHAELQDRVKDKKSGKLLDITDITDPGKKCEGRIIYFKVKSKEVKELNQTFPEYGNFDLLKRDDPIPDEVLEKWEEFLEAAENDGFDNPIDALIHFPEQKEIEESMSTEVFLWEEKEGKKKDKDKKKDEQEQDDLESELEEMSMKKLRKWVEKNIDEDDYEEVFEEEDLDKVFEEDKDDIIEKIVEYMKE